MTFWINQMNLRTATKGNTPPTLKRNVLSYWPKRVETVLATLRQQLGPHINFDILIHF